MNILTMETPTAVELLQSFIQFDTTNPPGNEAACITFIRNLLDRHGIATQIINAPNGRLNLIARVPGQGNTAPLMFYGHADVVTTQNQHWQHSPFSGDIRDGYVWGRGALDMKGGLAMMLSALLRYLQRGETPSGNLLFVVVSDEEAGGEFGAKYLVQEHADLFSGIRCAIGEFGGFTQYIGGKRFYPIQVAEKVPCKIEATLRGRGGHSSLYLPNSTMTQLGRFLERISQTMLPAHITPIVRQFISEIAGKQAAPLRLVLRSLLDPRLTDSVIQTVKHVQPQILDLVPLLRNTVNATVVEAGNSLNVIPEQATLKLDARLLPGFSPEQLIAEVRRAVGMGDAVEYRIAKWEALPTPPFDPGFYNMLVDVLRQADPEGTPVPLMLNASSDARHFAKLGIQTFGFLPMNLPPDFNFQQTIHASDERIPIASLNFGVDCLFDVLQRHGR
jgi:acetylornithine deacetylase/succinyl-diaminopimelate desuccinylase-like protein